MIGRLPALSGNMALGITRAPSANELYALRSSLACHGIPGFGMPHSLAGRTTIILYDFMMGSGYTNVVLQKDSKNSASMMFYYSIS